MSVSRNNNFVKASIEKISSICCMHKSSQANEIPGIFYYRFKGLCQPETCPHFKPVAQGRQIQLTRHHLLWRRGIVGDSALHIDWLSSTDYQVKALIRSQFSIQAMVVGDICRKSVHSARYFFLKPASMQGGRAV